MNLSQILLINFRNYQQFSYSFTQPITIFLGPNGIGKTNILEAINLLSLGDTFRDNKIEELVKLDAEIAHIGGNITNPDTVDVTRLQLSLTRGVYQGKRVPRRRYQVNDISRAKAKFVGQLTSVCFRPEDLRIVEGSPARRRKFLDETLSQIDRKYATSLATYTKALRSRNKILEMIREGRTSQRSIEYYDQTVIEHGEYLQLQRQHLIDYFNHTHHYQDFGLSLTYDHSIISRERLDQYQHQELAAGYTLVGPHRDDLLVKQQVTHRQAQGWTSNPTTDSGQDKKQDKYDISKYGSRGQQRMAVLWLKLLSLEYLAEQMNHNQRPILLLDDIFSELDPLHRQIVFDLCQSQQTIVTTADAHYLADFKQAKVVDLSNVK